MQKKAAKDVFQNTLALTVISIEDVEIIKKTRQMVDIMDKEEL